MNSLILNSPLWFPSLLSSQSSPHSRSIYTYHSICPPRPLSIRRQQQQTFAVDAVPSNEGVVSVINFEDLLEKDWSFLDSDGSNSVEQIDRIISAGEIDKTSRVLISTGSGDLVDRVVDSSPCSLLLVVHDSLFVLAGIKEKYDKVKCWQGEVIYVPEKWVPLDVVFLYFLPALPFTLDQVLEALASRVSPGKDVKIKNTIKHCIYMFRPPNCSSHVIYVYIESAYLLLPLIPLFVGVCIQVLEL